MIASLSVYNLPVSSPSRVGDTASGITTPTGGRPSQLARHNKTAFDHVAESSQVTANACQEMVLALTQSNKLATKHHREVVAQLTMTRHSLDALVDALRGASATVAPLPLGTGTASTGAAVTSPNPSASATQDVASEPAVSMVMSRAVVSTPPTHSLSSLLFARLTLCCSFFLLCRRTRRTRLRRTP